ncbi:hypothetical protein K402DRAFT_324584 [Aulographum hederae CBS 113979]|uniref:Peroxisome assembly protein 12 n=1 Tax=Aulographum hederae CBS 113979 TaxID=1176131 RepID=A0A6G1HCP6_9PEZI|nr:hypothetical protein K402DRAFT_324584 [Aulographum hederae CBS 113979]
MEFMTSLQGGLDELKPSLFELLSEQQLATLIPPSLRYLLIQATHRYPRYLLRALNSFDELHALLMLLVERHFLKSYGGGFTENFYGLKRERVLRVKGGELPRAQLGAAEGVRESLKLRELDIWKNLAVMVALPYIKGKLDEGYDIHAAHAAVLGPAGWQREELPERPTLKQRWMRWYKWFLRRVYPSLNAAYYFATLAFSLAYLFDSSKYSSPFLWLIGTRIRRLGEADHRAIALATQPPTMGASAAPGARPGQGNSIFNPRTMAQTIYPRLLSSLRILLPTSIFALKFLEWWHASDFARQLSRKAAEGLELPPPVIAGLAALMPKASQRAVGGSSRKDPAGSMSEKPGQSASSVSLSNRRPTISASTLLPVFTVSAPTASTSSLCPICSSAIVTPTATPYGFVYCYTCIHRWVDGTHERQEAFMEGGGSESEEGWEKEEGSREGRWESGKGRDAVTGKRILGGTEGLRRVMV